MNKPVFVLAAAITALAGCGVKGAPSPAAPLWGEPDREAPPQLDSPRSNIEEVAPGDIDQLVDQPEFLNENDDDPADDE